MPLIEAGFNWIGGSGDLEKLLTAEDAEKMPLSSQSRPQGPTPPWMSSGLLAPTTTWQRILRLRVADESIGRRGRIAAAERPGKAARALLMSSPHDANTNLREPRTTERIQARHKQTSAGSPGPLQASARKIGARDEAMISKQTRR